MYISSISFPFVSILSLSHSTLLLDYILFVILKEKAYHSSAPLQISYLLYFLLQIIFLSNIHNDQPPP